MHIIYGKPNCPQCDQAKKLLTDSGFDYQYIDLSKNLSKREEFVNKGYRSVPIIFEDHIEIGTLQDLKKILNP